MIVFALVGVLLSLSQQCGATPPAPAEGLPSVVESDSLERLYAAGRSFSDFLAAAKSRRETWLSNYTHAGVPGPLLERARMIPGRWRLLVVAEDWCGDSANTIPYIAKLLDSLSAVELRVVNSRDGGWVMKRHLTPDGRAATPTIILLDSAGAEAGCFVERPRALQAWFQTNKPQYAEADLQKGKAAWRQKDAGQSTIRDVIEMLESAARGAPSCASSPQSP